MTIYDEIINTCRYVCQNSKHVKINYNEIDKLLNEGIPTGKYWGESNLFGFMDLKTEEIVNYLLLYQSIGFSFWGDIKWQIDKYDGSTALMYVFIKNIDFFKNFKNVENMSLDQFKEITKGNIEIPLLKERYEILTTIAKIVNEKMNGNFYQYIYEIKDDINLINIIISNFNSFKDTRTYLDKEIKFYKLASLLTSDILHVKKIKEGINVDYSHIAGCSDYKIPQILRALNITTYDDELSTLIDSKTEIEEGSNYEIEIRSAVIEVERYIVSKTGICGIDVNDFLWLKSKETVIDKPYHRTRTITY